MKKRMIAILLTFVLTISNSAIAWAAPVEGTQDSTVSEEVENSERVEESEIGIGEDETYELDLNEEEIWSDGIENTSVPESKKPEDKTGVPEEKKVNAVLNDNEPQTIAAENENGEGLFAGGTGVDEDPYQIVTAEQMNNVRKNLSASYVLMNDIDLSEYSNWEPIGGAYPTRFDGTFDGRNHVITGLTITETKTEYVGLFGNCGIASIRNLNLKNISIKISYKEKKALSIGAISGNGGGISNCNVDGNINVEADCDHISVGGIAGKESGVESCISNVLLYLTNTGVIISGGIVGGEIAYDNEDSSISNCFNYGGIEAYGKDVYCGGIYGAFAHWPLFGGVGVTQCINYGKITVYADNKCYSGGIIGYDTERADISSCVNYGDIEGDSGTNNCVVGGIIGVSQIGVISNCFNTGNINGKGYRIRGSSVYNTQLEECYSLNSVLVNGKLATENLGTNQPNGANLSEEEILRKVKELFGDKINDNDKKIIIPDDVWQQGNWTTKFEEKFYTQLYSGGEVLLMKAKNPGHVGLCFGMTYTALMLNDGTISPQSFNRKKVTDILMADRSYSLKDPDGSISASDWIKYAYLYQYSPEYSREENRNKLTSTKDTQTFQKLADNIKKSIDNQEYGIINVEKFLSSHTLLAIDYTENADRLAINVYDCNHPQDAELYLYLYKDKLTGKYKAYKYDDGNGLNWTELSFIPRLSFIQGSSSIRSWLLERGVVTLSDKTDKYSEKTSEKLRLLSTKQYNFNLQVNNHPVKIEYQNSDNTELVLPIKLSSDVTEEYNSDVDKLFWIADEDVSYTASENDVFAVADDEDFIEFTIPQNTSVNVSKETKNGKTATVTGMKGQEISVKYSIQVDGKNIEYIIKGKPSEEVSISMYNQEVDINGFITGKITAITGEDIVEKYFTIDKDDSIHIKQDNENISVISISDDSNPGTGKPAKPGESSNLKPSDNNEKFTNNKGDSSSDDKKELVSSDKAPDTRDDSSMIWFITLMLSVGCIIALTVSRNRMR